MTNLEETIDILYKFRYQTVNETVNDALEKTIDIINKNSTIQKEYKIEIMLIIQDVLKQCTQNDVSKNTITICKKLVSILKNIKESNVPVIQTPINRLREKINFCIELYQEKWELEKIANFPGLTGNSIVQLKIIKELPKFQNYILQRLDISFKTLEKSISDCNNPSEVENFDKIFKTLEENERKTKESINKLNSQIKAISNIHIKSEEFQSFFVNKNIKSQSEEGQKTDERLQIVIDNNHECYINFDKIWNKNSRWHQLKNEIVAKGLTKSKSLYFSLPIHRSIFVLGSGNFGNVEIGFSKTFHAVVIRRLTDIGMIPENCLNLIKAIKKITNIAHTNLLKSNIAQDVCGHTFYYNKLCDYNLSEYITQMNENNKLKTDDLIKRISFQIVKGLAALHLNSPSIVHGNLKPTNVFIDENGILKLAEFGIYKVFFVKALFFYLFMKFCIFLRNCIVLKALL